MINQKQKKEGLFKRKKKEGCKDGGQRRTHFFAFYVKKDWAETFTLRKRKKKKNRELLKRRINDGHFLSFGTSCQNCGTLTPRTGQNGGGQNNDLQMSRLIQCVLLEGVWGVEARDSIVIYMVLRCNCSISNNVVRLAVQIGYETVIVEELIRTYQLTSRCCKQ